MSNRMLKLISLLGLLLGSAVMFCSGVSVVGSWVQNSNSAVPILMFQVGIMIVAVAVLVACLRDWAS